jgi:hypothetical protein
LPNRGIGTPQFNLGSLYYQGLGVSQDYQEAVKWMRRAAEQGHVSAQTTLGTIYARVCRGKTKKIIPRPDVVHLCCAQGDPNAMEFRDSLVVKMTPAKSRRRRNWPANSNPRTSMPSRSGNSQSLAEQGDRDAQFNLGVIYYVGQGSPVNYTLALKWFKKAVFTVMPGPV